MNKILVIAENYGFIDDLSKNGLKGKFEITHFDNVFNALKNLYSADYDIVIYDIDTSTLDAYLTIKSARTINRKIKIIILTEDTSLENITRIKNYNIDYLNFKPVDIEQLKKNLLNISERIKSRNILKSISKDPAIQM